MNSIDNMRKKATSFFQNLFCFRSLLKRNKIFFTVIFGLITSIGVIYAILHPNIKENSQKEPAQQNQENIHIQSPNPVINAENSAISINQSGGITAKTFIKADTVNIAPQDRRITPEQLNIFLPAIKLLSQTKLNILYAKSNREQKQFAEDIMNALRTAGINFEVKSSTNLISPYGDGMHFAINSEQPYPVGTAELQKALKEARIDSQWHGSSELPRDFIKIVVNERP